MSAALVLQADLEYWGLDEESMEACCGENSLLCPRDIITFIVLQH